MVNQLLVCITILAVFILKEAYSVDVPRLVLISFDGFRPDYVNETDTPNLFRLAKNGVTGRMRSQFVTKTFPNHLSIVTGMYEEIHGVINNKMYDPVMNKTFGTANTEVEWWDNNSTIPIWVANELQNDGFVRNSGVVWWPGSTTPFKGHLSRFISPYGANVTQEEKLDLVIKWSLDDKDPTNLIVVYFPEVDKLAHKYGPWGREVLNEVRRSDELIGYLIEQLKKANLLSKTNIMVVSDHGMVEVKRPNIIELDKYLPSEWYRMYGSSPNIGIIPNEGKEELVYQKLLNGSKTGNFSVFRKEEVPLRFHYRHHRRILPIQLLGDEGFEIVGNLSQMWYIPSDIWGEHGYDNDLLSMRPLFIASGPAFKSGYVHSKTFDNVDLYPLMCLILRLFPLESFPSNGTLENIGDILKPMNVVTFKNGGAENWFESKFN